jgi:hypothetical protein
MALDAALVIGAWMWIMAALTSESSVFCSLLRSTPLPPADPGRHDGAWGTIVAGGANLQ